LALTVPISFSLDIARGDQVYAYIETQSDLYPTKATGSRGEWRATLQLGPREVEKNSPDCGAAYAVTLFTVTQAQDATMADLLKKIAANDYRQGIKESELPSERIEVDLPLTLQRSADSCRPT
jgi:hypothetical protein